DALFRCCSERGAAGCVHTGTPLRAAGFVRSFGQIREQIVALLCTRFRLGADVLVQGLACPIPSLGRLLPTPMQIVESREISAPVLIRGSETLPATQPRPSLPSRPSSSPQPR